MHNVSHFLYFPVCLLSLGNIFLVLFFYFDVLVFLDVFWCAESENDVSFFVVSAIFL